MHYGAPFVFALKQNEAKKRHFFACLALKRKARNHKQNENEQSEISKVKQK
jgi:hypothetical protein